MAGKFLNHNLSVQNKLTVLMLTAATLSASLVGVIAFCGGKSALNNQVLDHLNSIRVTRGAAVANYLNLYRVHVETLTESEKIIQMMCDFRSAFSELKNREIPASVTQELLTYYRQEQVPRLAKQFDGEPIPGLMLPSTSAGQYLHHNYLAKNPEPVGQKFRFAKSDGDTQYDKAHERHHQRIANLVDHLGFYDFMLVDAATTDIVYSYRKEVDLGATLSDGYLSLTRLSKAIERLRRDQDRRSFELVDFESYRPSFGRPAAFVASPIFDDDEMVGVLVLQMPTDRINNLLSNNREWDAAGLGQTGEILLVGDDYLLRSESRHHLESPDQLFADLELMGVATRDLARIKDNGTVILSEAVHTEAIEKSRLGYTGVGQMRDYRGKPVLVSYGPLEIEDLDWNVVVKMDVDEAYASIYSLGRLILITVTAIGLLVCVCTLLATHRLLLPLQRIMMGVEKVANGQIDVEVPASGNDEFGQLGTAFNNMAQQLRKRSDLLSQEIAKNEQLLVSTLPQPAIEGLKRGIEPIPETFAAVSLIWAELNGLESLETGRDDQQCLALYHELIAAMDDVGESCGVEKLGSLAGKYIAICGLSDQRIDHLHRMAEYGCDLIEVLERFNIQHKSEIGIQIGLTTGPVSGSLAGRTRYSYELWGPAIQQAQKLANSGQANAILLDPETYDLLCDVGSVGEHVSVVDQDIDPETTFGKKAA